MSTRCSSAQGYLQCNLGAITINLQVENIQSLQHTLKKQYLSVMIILHDQ